ncbi:MAG TPA: permease [Treponemataceae bacterium]|nr:permease [Treponemataceae bacterium]
MNNQKKTSFLRRYRVVFIAIIIFCIFIFIKKEMAPKAISSLTSQLGTMALIIPPIFLLLGLLDVWVPRDTLMKFMGEKSGIKGKLIAFAIGSAAAGPLYGAFPVASVLMKKGAGFTNILIFIGAWSTTKIPMLLFEMQSVGVRFALARLAIDIPGIIIIAWLVKRLMPAKEIEKLYEGE